MTSSEHELRKRLELEADDPAALSELARLVGGDRRRRDEAIELQRRAARVARPDELPEALLQLARLQVEARQERAAIESLQDALDLEPELAAAHDLLGELLRRAGQLEEAAVALRRAAELDPEGGIRSRLALVTTLDALGRSGESEEVIGDLQKAAMGNQAVAALLREFLSRRL